MDRWFDKKHIKKKKNNYLQSRIRNTGMKFDFLPNFIVIYYLHFFLPVDLQFLYFPSALVDLNGRFFAGREVRANFFDYDKYMRGELDS
jgi:hypothetical protein